MVLNASYTHLILWCWRNKISALFMSTPYNLHFLLVLFCNVMVTVSSDMETNSGKYNIHTNKTIFQRLKHFSGWLYWTISDTCRCWCLCTTLWGRSSCGAPSQEACESHTVIMLTPDLYSEAWVWTWWKLSDSPWHCRNHDSSWRYFTLDHSSGILGLQVFRRTDVNTTLTCRQQQHTRRKDRMTGTPSCQWLGQKPADFN